MTADRGAQVASRFTLVELLGSGGFGEVWLAEDERTGAPIALKLLHARHRQNRRVLERFVKEAELLGRLEHPNIARAVGWAADGTDVFLALEFVEGETLKSFLGRRVDEERLLDPRELLELFVPLCLAIAHAHERQVVHRDLKPQNVMVVGDGAHRSVKVLDFGIAKILTGDASDATTQGRVLGSLMYLSPEQCAGEPIDGRADVFALGSLLFELATLRKAWVRTQDGQHLPALGSALKLDKDNGAVAIMHRILRDPRPRPSAYRPDLGPAFDRVVERALAIEPARRTPSARELAAEAEAALAGAGERTAVDRALEAPEPTARELGAPLTRVVPRELDGAGLTDGSTYVRTPVRPLAFTEATWSESSLPRARRSARGVSLALGAVVVLSVATFARVALDRPATPTIVRAEGGSTPNSVVALPPKAAPEPSAPGPTSPAPADPPAQGPGGVAARAPRPRAPRAAPRPAPRDPSPAAPTPAPVEPTPAAKIRGLAARVGTDPSAAGSLTAAILKEAESLADPGLRRRVEACVAGANAIGDRAELTRCADRLLTATAPR